MNIFSNHNFLLILLSHCNHNVVLACNGKNHLYAADKYQRQFNYDANSDKKNSLITR